MSEYCFVTVWLIDAQLERVWDAIEDVDAWPMWWKGVLSVELLARGDEDGIGSVRRTVWKSVLPYKLTFDSEVIRVERYSLIEARAFGELEGNGVWRFEGHGGAQTRLRYDWTVRTTKGWMNMLAPIARPLFQWNHDTIMRWGETGLKGLLAQ